jgi:hypothetical protein
MTRHQAEITQPAAAAAEWRLALRAPIKVYDEYSETTIKLVPGQIDPGRVEGLIIDFRYVAADGEMTRRSLLCWQCGRAADRIYVRGYCPFREELRTFRIDRMRDLVAFQNGRETVIESPSEFFSAFAADETDEAEIRRLTAGNEDE